MGYRNNNDRRFWKRFTCSFVYAINGLINVIKHEQNMKIHLTIAPLIIVLAFLLEISKTEKMIVFLIIGIVLALEVLNTAIERTVDLVTTEYHPVAKIAKDVSAAAVLVFSVFAFIIGVMIFMRPLLHFLGQY